MHATRAAVEEGMVPGGGSALATQPALNSVKAANDDQKIGVDIVRRALFNPLRQIAENAGVDGAVVAGKIRESKDHNIGYDAQMDKYTNMVSAGIIDPTKVVRTALRCCICYGIINYYRSYGS